MKTVCRQKLNYLNSALLEEIKDMVVEVKLFATFREGRFSEKKMDLSGGSSIGDLLKCLKIPEKEAKVLIVNGQAVSFEYKLNNNDVVAIFPPIAGG